MDLEKDTYYGTSFETDPQRIEDAGTGRPIVMRRFQFKYPPTQKGIPTKKQILTEGYIKYLENFLWADALEMVLEPRVVYEKGGFSVFATCQAKKGNKFRTEDMEQIRPLQEILQGK